MSEERAPQETISEKEKIGNRPDEEVFLNIAPVLSPEDLRSKEIAKEKEIARIKEELGITDIDEDLNLPQETTNEYPDLSLKMIDETNELEIKLEKEWEGERNIEGGGNKKKNRSRLANWLQVTLAALMISGTAKGEAVDHADQGHQRITQKENISSDHVSQNEQEHHEEMRKMLIEKVGFDLLSSAEKAGFDVKFEVDNENGPYVVHIGQRHYVSNIENDDPTEINEIIDSQKNIEQVLSSFPSEEPNKKVFEEGAEMGQVYQELHIEMNKDELSHIIPSKGCFLEVMEVYNDLIGQYGNERMKTIINYVYKQKLSELLDYYHTHPGEYVSISDQESGDFTNADEECGFVSQQIISKFDLFGEDAIYAAGAVEKLAVEGKVTIEGVETKQANEAAVKAANEKYALMASAGNDKADDPNFGSKIKALNKIIFDDRNEVVFDSIEKQKGTQKIVPLVFGYSHNFKSNVTNFNQNHPDKKMGLIKLRPHL